MINRHLPEEDYPQICFDYIHNNPVTAGLVASKEQWDYSSALDYTGLREGKLINKRRAEEFGIKYN